MSAWRIVPSTGGSFWLEREGNGGPGESIYLSGPGDAKAALAALRVHLKAKVEAPPRSSEQRAIELAIERGSLTMASRPLKKDRAFITLGKRPVLLDTSLESNYRVVTLQLARRHWESYLYDPDDQLDTNESRFAANEDTARANHAALCGEFGP